MAGLIIVIGAAQKVRILIFVVFRVIRTNKLIIYFRVSSSKTFI